ncbi:hypothetical protein DDV98_13350 [Streptomyces sp. IB2014 011-12]|nr:hypothetical protein DDV98_13350 [Streptomyces sp. IB2014 011-12]
MTCLPAGRERDGLRAEVICTWLPMAHRIASRFRDRGETMDDLRQVAAIGLVKAVDRFDPLRATAFETYAVPTVVGELKRHFRDHTFETGSSERLPDPGRRRRRREDLVRSSLPGEAAVLEQEAGVRRARRREIMRGLDDRHPVGDERRQQRPDPVPGLRVQAGGRLIEEQEVRLLREPLGDEGALTLPA